MIRFFLSRYLITIIFLVLLCIPFFLWGNNFLVGGDDTKLYYIFPEYFLKNFAFNIISDNTLAGAATGYGTVSYFAPLFYVFYIFKSISPVNSQMLLYGLNLSFGFLGMYLLLGQWVNEKKYERIISGLFYVFSIYLIQTLYKHQLLSIYLVSVLPLTLFFLIKGIRDKSFFWTILSVSTFSLFSSTLNVLPWVGAFFISCIPLLLYLFFSYRKVFINHLFIWAILFIGLNFYWLFHFLYSSLFPGNAITTTNFYSSETFVGDNLRIIEGVSRLINPVQVIMQQMQFNLSAYYFIPGILGIVIFIAIIFSIYRSFSPENTKYRGFFTFSLSSFLISWFCFSPGFGDWGPKLFIYFSTTIPFFTMFRNMYDKFALSLAFYFAFLVFLSLVLLGNNRNNFLKKVLYFSIAGIICFNGYIFYQNTRIKSEAANSFSGEFNNDFNNLVNDLSTLPTQGKVLWLPLNVPTYAVIEDAHKPNNFYVGLSPLRVLANRSDYTGRFSFITANDLFLSDKVIQALKEKNYGFIETVFKDFGIHYIITSNQELPSDLKSFLYDGKETPYLTMQDAKLYDYFLGNKIRDYGLRYSLYSVKTNNIADVIYLNSAGLETNTSDQIKFQKISSSYYLISLSLSKNSELVFSDPYSDHWKLYYKDTEVEVGNHTRWKDFANRWELNITELNQRFGSLDNTIDLELRFKPDSYSYFANIISFCTLIILGYLTVYYLYISKKR